MDYGMGYNETEHVIVFLHGVNVNCSDQLIQKYIFTEDVIFLTFGVYDVAVYGAPPPNINDKITIHGAPSWKLLGNVKLSRFRIHIF